MRSILQFKIGMHIHMIKMTVVITGYVNSLNLGLTQGGYRFTGDLRSRYFIITVMQLINYKTHSLFVVEYTNLLVI